VSVAWLLSAVPEVCRHVDPHGPASVSRRQYDAARGRAGYPDLPTSGQVLRRTRSRSWPELTRTLTDKRRDPDRALGQRAGREQAGQCTQAQAVLALRDTARALDQRTMTAREYDDIRTRVNHAARRRRLTARLPTVGQIEHALGGWTQACCAAGLRSGPSAPRPVGLAVVDALEIAVDSLGVVPSRRQLERLARHNGVALARPAMLRADAVAEVRARRAARGLPMPALAAALPIDRFDVDVLALVGSRSHQGRWGFADCQAAVRAWLTGLQPGERPTQRSYARWQARHPGRPAASALGRHGGLQRLRRDVVSGLQADHC
jgi:hypothetical protein